MAQRFRGFCIEKRLFRKKRLTKIEILDILAKRLSGGRRYWILKIEQCEQDGTLDLERFKEADSKVIKS